MTTIMGHSNGPQCPICKRKIRQGQRVSTDDKGRKVHAYAQDCKRSDRK